MAELLIKASKHWMDDLNGIQYLALPDKKKITYSTRTQLGDIIIVRPDGWIWGTEECLPRFIVVKLKGVSCDIVKYYEDALIDTNGKLLKIKKFRIPEIEIASYISTNQSVIEINKSGLVNEFISNIVAKG